MSTLPSSLKSPTSGGPPWNKAIRPDAGREMETDVIRAGGGVAIRNERRITLGRDETQRRKRMPDGLSIWIVGDVQAAECDWQQIRVVQLDEVVGQANVARCKPLVDLERGRIAQRLDHVGRTDRRLRERHCPSAPTRPIEKSGICRPKAIESDGAPPLATLLYK